jgi:CRP/FNR family transcriptional regulator
MSLTTSAEEQGNDASVNHRTAMDSSSSTEGSSAQPRIFVVDGGPHPVVVRCSGCRLRSQCVTAELDCDALDCIDGRLVSVRRKVAHGETLFHAGDSFDAVFAVWTGFFKTVVTTRQGHEQVAGFLMPGDLIGLKGIDVGLQAVDAVALQDSQVCVIPYAGLQALAREAPSLQQQLLRLMSRKIVNDHRTMVQLGSMSADERVVAFLLDLGVRLEARGYSGSSLVLPMGRADVGSYLSLTPETVSRAFSRLQAGGLLQVCQRQVHITDLAGLRRVLDRGPERALRVRRRHHREAIQ